MEHSNILINCDMGEGFDDQGIMPHIQMCNIACGGHTGTQLTMLKTVQLAKKYGVMIGAHPSYPDKTNFGRKSMKIPQPKLKESLENQIQALIEICIKENTNIHHIKFHGALYNDFHQDTELRERLLNYISTNHPNIPILIMADSSAEKATKDADLPFLREVFIDRSYLDINTLTPRNQPRALVENHETIKGQLQAINSGNLKTSTGKINIGKIDTLCIHSDTPKATLLAETLNFEVQKL